VTKILLVSPDVAVTNELTYFLQHFGFQVTSAIEGWQVMAALSRGFPDVIVMRESTHRRNGDELCLHIREMSSVPIIILGQGAQDAAGVEMLEMGADAYLTAPLNPRELLARIRALLRRSRAARAPITEDTEFGHAR